MTPDVPPRESNSSRSPEQGETEQQKRQNPESNPGQKAENVLVTRDICPYLGLRDDHTVVSMRPTPAHACFAQRPRYSPSPEHQMGYCLTTNYPRCRIYPDKKPAGKAVKDNLYTLHGESRKDRRSRTRWPGWLGLVLLLALVSALAYAVMNGLLPLPEQLALNLPPTATGTVAESDTAPAVVSEGRESTAEVPTEQPAEAAATETTVPGSTLTPDSVAAVNQDTEPPDAQINAGSLTMVTPTITETPLAPTSTSTPLESTPASAAQATTPATTNTPVTRAITPSAAEAETSTPVPTPTSAPASAVATRGAAPAASATPRPTAVTPESEEQVITVTPGPTDVAWWSSAQTQPEQAGDSFLYAGVSEGQAYLSIVRFDLRSVPRDAEIESIVLQLTGLQDDRMERSSNSTWAVQLIAEGELPELNRATFFDIYGVQASIELTPTVESADVGRGRVNEWVLDDAAQEWFSQQLLDNVTSVSVRIVPLANSGNSLFAWDSGHGSESRGAAPELVLTLSPTPPALTMRP